MKTDHNKSTQLQRSHLGPGDNGMDRIFNSVWDALCSNSEEAAQFEARSDLMKSVLEQLRRPTRLSEAKAARLFKVPRAKVRLLKQGKLSRFTEHQLRRMVDLLQARRMAS